MSLLRLYGKALRQGADKVVLSQFKPPGLPTCEYDRQVLVEKSPYQKYCDMVGWDARRPLHPCYLQMLSLPLQLKCLTTPKSPFPVMGLVHMGNRIRLSHTYEIGVPVHLYASYSGVRQHHRGWEIDITVSGRQERQRIYEATASYLVRVNAAHVEPERNWSRRAQDDAPLVLPEGMAVCGELAAGRGTGRRYAALSGDVNPIHLSRLSASVLGFRKAIAHGMWSLAATGSVILKDAWQDPAPQSGSVLLQNRFMSPLMLPGKAQVYATPQGSEREFIVTNTSLSAAHLQGTLTLSS